MDGTEVPWWSPYVAVLALAVSIGFNVWQAWDRRRERKPDVVLTGQFRPSADKDMLTGILHVCGSATVVTAGIAPPTGRRGWIERRASIHDGSGRGPLNRPSSLPRVLVDRNAWFVMDLYPLPRGGSVERGTRIWVRTSTRHWFVSPVVAPLCRTETEAAAKDRLRTDP